MAVLLSFGNRTERWRNRSQRVLAVNPWVRSLSFSAFAALLLCGSVGWAEHPQRDLVRQADCPDASIVRYTAHRTTEPLQLDGRLDEPSWQKATRSSRFVDIITGEPALLDTRVSVLWDDENLYVGFWVEEPLVRARMTQRDDIIFLENDVEVFIDGGDAYYELELNALNTIYEVFFIWQDAYKRGGRFDVPEFDLFSGKALSFPGEGAQGRAFWWGVHPRGLRWAFPTWDFPGLQTAVHVLGTLNDNSDVDEGWQVELKFPWQGMKWLAGDRPLPPRDGDVWRILFARFERFPTLGREASPHAAWFLSKHGIQDTHRPECFPYIHFSRRRAGD